jgi:kynurenine formamidase
MPKNLKRWTQRPEGSNWGDFGADDQVGRLNTLTPEMRRAAVAEVREGKCFVLSLPLDYPGDGTEPDSPRTPPRLFARALGGNTLYNMPLGRLVVSDDCVELTLQYSTQWDSLAHVGMQFDVDGSGKKVPVYYNGFRAGVDIVGPDGNKAPCAHCLGIENMAMTGVQGRGVLFNFVDAFGRGRTMVGYDKLMKVIDDQKIDVRKGDFLLFYTGFGDALMAMKKKPDNAILDKTAAAIDGTDKKLLNWITDTGVVSLISDNPAVEYADMASDVNSHNFLPLHEHCIFKLGIHLGEYFWLTDLANHLREAKRSAFLFTGPPLRLPGAVGSPASPVATV